MGWGGAGSVFLRMTVASPTAGPGIGEIAGNGTAFGTDFEDASPVAGEAEGGTGVPILSRDGVGAGAGAGSPRMAADGGAMAGEISRFGFAAGAVGGSMAGEAGGVLAEFAGGEGWAIFSGTGSGTGVAAGAGWGVPTLRRTGSGVAAGAGSAGASAGGGVNGLGWATGTGVAAGAG